MPDPTASWLPDPTGRHDHRYWDGSGWTDHVADAGVAGTDPFEALPPPPPPPPLPPPPPPPPPLDTAPSEPADDPTVPEPDPTDPTDATDATDVTEDATEPEDVVEPGDSIEPERTADLAEASRPEDAADPYDAAADDASGSGDHVSDEGLEHEHEHEHEPDGPHEPADEAARDGVPDDVSGVEDRTDDTLVVEAPAAEDPDPTVPIPTVDATDQLPVVSGDDPSPPPPDAPMPPISPVEVPGSSRTGLVIGVALLAVVAIVVALVVLVSGGDSQDDSAAAISRRMADKLQQEEGLRNDDARCVADRLVAEIGTKRLADVDFDADTPPKDLQHDIDEAFPKAITACHVGGPTTFEDQGELDSYLQQLADSFLSMYGLTAEQAQCLARAMTPAIGTTTSLDDAFGQFQQDLATCGISDDDLISPAP
jgi:hypothetical protein